MTGPEVVLIAAMDRNRVIGKDQHLPWHLPEDLKHFKAVTLGHPVLMGRKTYESIGRPLPKRLNLVLTRQADWSAEGVESVNTVEAALSRVGESGRLFVIGGEEIYRLFLSEADRLILTRVDTEVADGDAVFPEWEEASFVLTSAEEHPADDRHAFGFRFEEYAAAGTEG